MLLRSIYYTRKSFETLEFPRENLREFQKSRLKDVIEACQGVPFYAERWPEEFLFETVEDVSELPLTRDNTLGGYTAGAEPDRGNDVSRRTSGSTGTPAEIAFTSQADDWLTAIHVRTLFLLGFQLRDKIAKFWYRKRKRSLPGGLLMPRTSIEPGASLDEQIETLKSRDPDVIDYYPQMLLAVCKKLDREGVSGVDPGKVFTHGEVLTPRLRRYVEETLDAEVRDYYASTEFGTVGWECPEGGYHMAEDSVHVEVLVGDGRPAAPGEPGRLVLTGLVNQSHPLMRYDTGDIAELSEEQCSCKTSFKRLKGFKGRENDVFKDSAGRAVYPENVVDMIAPVDDILYFQVVAGDSQYTLRYVPNSGEQGDGVEMCAEKLRTDLSLEPLQVEEVEEIPRNEGGKLEIIRNEQPDSL